MAVLFRLLSVVALGLGLAGAARADSGDGKSKLPPSSPGAPIDLGVIDRPQNVGSQSLFLCRRFTVDLVWNQPAYSTRYFKFRVDQDGSRVYFKMTENPTRSMWFLLYGSDPNAKDPEAIIGADHEEFNREMAKGTYHIRVATDADQNHTSNGHNVGQVVVRGLAPGLPDRGPAPPSNINRGEVPTGTPLVHKGQLAFMSARSMAVPPATSGDNCPVNQTQSPVWPLYNHMSQQIMITAPAGKLKVDLREVYKLNWTRNFQVWVPTAFGGPTPIQNGEFDHKGGAVTLTISNEAATIPANDMYIAYELRVSR